VTSRAPDPSDRRRLPPSFYNGLTLAGGGLAGTSLGLIAFLALLEAFTPESHPYVGIIAFVILPVFLFLGLLLGVFGVVRQVRRGRRGLPLSTQLPRLDLNDARHRRALLFVAAGSMLFLVLSAFGTFQAYEYTESNAFCGGACHAVMHPEYTAYRESPHARVRCVECHIGSGARWFVRSKLSGAYQVYSVLFDRYPRPIPTPIESLRPSRETCEQCHWPEYFFHEKLVVRDYYLSDDANTHVQLHLLMKIGGADPGSGRASGIHWHMNLANEVRYFATDERRQQIPWVRVRGKDGVEKTYVDATSGFSPADVVEADVRRLDCIDCHNRPTHRYHPPAERVNLALSQGRMDPTLAGVKAAAVQALEQPYASSEAALEGISAALWGFYREQHPELAASRGDAVAAAVAETQRIYQSNYFPSMGVSWKAFPDNRGHVWASGCFRCHDGNHVSEDGSVISRDCGVCHTLLSEQTAGGSERVSLEGVGFQHPAEIGDAWQAMSCSTCHAGG
jgi:hypothetical protein